jgi:hypothetical protein
MSAESNEKEVLLKIELDTFSNAIAMDMGLRIVELAKSRNQADCRGDQPAESIRFSLCGRWITR